MIPFDIVLASGSELWFPSGVSDVLLATLSAGFLGMGLSDITAGITGRLSGDDESEPGDGDDDFVGSGGDVDDFEDDEFGDMDGWDEDDDEFGDFGEDGGALDEIEPRLDEVENELASISSTMGTVRSENEAITETVDDIEDNIRKLLEIYEMVTRGVNPFVDDVEGSAGTGGSFGLFDGDASGGDGGEDLDPDVADADPDSFFDDDWDDDEFEADEGFDHELEREDGLDDDFEDPGDEDAGAESADSGKTFDQLKSEYEDGDEDWDGGDGEAAAGKAGASTTEMEAEATIDSAGSEPVSAAGVQNSGVEKAAEPGTSTEDAEPVTEDSTETTVPDDASAKAEDASPRTDGKPYLRTLPGGYATELLVIEWLSYLRSQSSTPEALRAIRYYETIGWVGEPAADALAKFLTGLAAEDGGIAPAGGTQLTVDHHTQSLGYIGRLGGANVQIERLEWAGSPRSARAEGGKQSGIQR